MCSLLKACRNFFFVIICFLFHRFLKLIWNFWVWSFSVENIVLNTDQIMDEPFLCHRKDTNVRFAVDSCYWESVIFYFLFIIILITAVLFNFTFLKCQNCLHDAYISSSYDDSMMQLYNLRYRNRFSTYGNGYWNRRNRKGESNLISLDLYLFWEMTIKLSCFIHSNDK